MQSFIRCKNRLLSLEKPIVMGILNVTPDSFFDGGHYQSPDKIAQQATKMIHEGADIIDIGGMSTKPGSRIIEIEAELSRVIPAIEIVLEKHPDAILSVDTIRAEVAAKAIEKGAAMVNDISGGLYDPEMLSTVASLKVPYVAMHMKGIPETMMQQTQYDDVVLEVFNFFSERVSTCTKMGVADLILDPGFGFSKTLEQNYLLLKNLNTFQALGKPILVGFSRKSMAHKLLNVTPHEALNATTVLNTLALTKGANILRVHDVKEAKELVKIWETLSQS
jgi:dihydropteroate synthase